jgi:ArsR family transcriptional regulator
MSGDRYPPQDFLGLLQSQGDFSRLTAAITECSEVAAAFLKVLSHPGRLTILCHLAAGERSVTELEAMLGARQAAVSQQLARLRLEGLVATRRDGKTIYYSIRDARVLAQMQLLQAMFGPATPTAI